jgi:hypothetical protein
MARTDEIGADYGAEMAILMEFQGNSDVLTGSVQTFSAFAARVGSVYALQSVGINCYQLSDIGMVRIHSSLRVCSPLE